MTPADLAPLRDVAKRLLDRDLAALAGLQNEDRGLQAKIWALEADIRRERAAAGANVTEQAAAERFALAAGRRIAGLEASRRALAERIEAARKAGERALGRRRAVDGLAVKAAREARLAAERRAETPPKRGANP